tara:strand:- start:84 stop:194 length:111 start_codon:yes stop_codon:yes gene_type:complete
MVSTFEDEKKFCNILLSPLRIAEIVYLKAGKFADVK